MKNSWDDIVLKLKSLQDAHENLLKENNANLIMIKELKHNFYLLESKNDTNKVTKTEETQTFSEQTNLDMYILYINYMKNTSFCTTTFFS